MTTEHTPESQTVGEPFERILMPPDPEWPTWGVTQAATECHVSKSTIRRYLKDGKFPNAVLDNGAWMIPIPDLTIAGLTPGKSVIQEDVDEQESEIERLENENAELRRMLDRERDKRENAEHMSGLMDQHLDDMRRSLRMIESTVSIPTAQRTEPPQPRRRWFRF